MAESTASFMFADIAGFTALTEAHGDEEAVALIGRFSDAVAAELPEVGGEHVKTIGDALMLRVPDPGHAIRLALRIVRGALGDHGAPAVRVGLHHGSAVERRGDYYGAAVNLAARVAGQSRGGQLLVTERVAVAARDVGAITTHVGQLELRNVSDRVDVYDVQIGPAVDTPAIDPVCQMRVPSTGGAAIVLDWAGRRFHFCGLPCLSRFAAAPDSYLARRSSS